MPFVARVPPAAPVLEVRAIARRIAVLVAERTRERNRWHALTATADHVAIVANDLASNIRHLEHRIELLISQAVAQIAATAPCNYCASSSCCPTT